MFESHPSKSPSAEPASQPPPSSQSNQTTQPFSQGHPMSKYGIHINNIQLPGICRELSSDLQPNLTRLVIMPATTNAHISVSLLTYYDAERPNPISYSASSDASSDMGISWLPLHLGNDDPSMEPVHALAISQIAQATGCRVNIRSLPICDFQCSVLFDPAHDTNLLLQNETESPIYCSPLIPNKDGLSVTPSAAQDINKGSALYISSGAWRFQLGSEGEIFDVCDIKIIPRRFLSVKTANPSAQNKRGNAPKRTAPDKSQPESPDYHGHKRVKESRENHRSVSPKAAINRGLIASHVNPLQTLHRGQTLEVNGPDSQSQYTVTAKDSIAKVRATEVFSATLSPSHPLSSADLPTLVAAKVLKTNGTPKSFMTVARTWSRETSIHSLLTRGLLQQFRGNNPSPVPIVRLLYSDARLLTLYLEHVNAHSLGDLHWREPNSHRFRGSLLDARCILFDMAKAIKYVHSQDILHNDIKPANILYNGEYKSAVLIDFGLATEQTGNTGVVCDGGTPWYVAPEYMVKGIRQEPADIYAIGVVMTYVLGLQGMPDTSARINWRIAHVGGYRHRDCPRREYREYDQAVASMQMWLSEVEVLRKKMEELAQGRGENLNGNDNGAERIKSEELRKEAYRIAARMLAWDPKNRIQGRDLEKCVRGWEPELARERNVRGIEASAQAAA